MAGPTTPQIEIWANFASSNGTDFTVQADVPANGAVTTKEFLARDAAFEATGVPSQILFDTADGLFFVVEKYGRASDGAIEFRILEGTIANAKNAGASHALTTVYDSGTDTATHGNDGVTGGVPGTFFGSFAIDPVSHFLYFADGGDQGTGPTYLERITYSPTTLGAGVGHVTLSHPDVASTTNGGYPGNFPGMALDIAGGFAYLAETDYVDTTTDANYLLKVNLSTGATTKLALTSTAGLVATSADQEGGISGFQTGFFNPAFGQISSVALNAAQQKLYFTTNPNGNTSQLGGIYEVDLTGANAFKVNVVYQQTATDLSSANNNGVNGHPGGYLTQITVDAANGKYYVQSASAIQSSGHSDPAIYVGNLTDLGVSPTRLFGTTGANAADVTAYDTGPVAFALDNAPVVAGSANWGTATETAGANSGASSAATGNLTVTDDEGQLSGASVAITTGFQAGTTHQDLLTIGGATSGTVSGITYSYVAATGILTLSGAATSATYSSVLSSVQYAVSGDDPTAMGSDTSRALTFTLNDGLLASVFTTSVTVIGVDDAPVLAGVGSAVGYTEQATPVTLVSGLTVADPDNANLTGATVTISAGFQSGDTLAATVAGGITASYDASSHVLTLSGTSTLANYQQVLRSVTFVNATNDDPTAGGTATTRTISVAASDGSLSSTAVTQTINVTAVDDPAVAVADTGTTAENAVLHATSVLANDYDVDGPALSIAKVNGAAVTFDTPITLASGALLTLHADGTYDYDPNHQFDYLVSAATAASTGASDSVATDSFTYTLTGGGTATVTETITGVDGTGDKLAGGTGNDVIVGSATAPNTFDLSQGGNDTVRGGAANDAFYFGAAFTGADHVDGGGGTNDQIGLEGDYTGANKLVLDATTITNVEVIAALPGHSYDITSNDGNVAAGQQLTIFAGNLLATDTFSFNGSAETDGAFRMFGSLGTDHLIGGAGDDGFLFGPGKFSAADTIDGGGGTNNQLALDGNYTMTLGGNVTNIQVLALLAGPTGSTNTFNLTASDAFVAAGKTMTVYAVDVVNPLSFDASAETNGHYTIFGGQAADTIHGGQLDDTIWGGLGADTLYGGGGNDVFRYDDASESTLAAPDTIMDFSTGDKIDLSRLDAAAGHAAQLTFQNMGNGVFQLQGDTNGDGVADFAINIHVTDGHAITSADVIL